MKIYKYFKRIENQIIVSFGSCMLYELSNVWISNSKMYLIFRKDTVLFVYDEKQMEDFIENNNPKLFFSIPPKKIKITLSLEFKTVNVSKYVPFVTWPRNVKKKDIATILYFLKTGKYQHEFSNIHITNF